MNDIGRLEILAHC